MILLNPGPVTLSQRVKKSLLRQDICHREPEFSDLQENIRRKLLQVYQLAPSNWAPVLVTGSGTSAVEAMLTSCVPKDGKVLVIENGVYGERMSEILRTYEIEHERSRSDWETAIDLSTVNKILSKKTYSHAAVVHHETTTGRLNNIKEISRLCEKHGTKLLIDGVSSFGAEEIPFGENPIVACAATANKCLHGVPGTSFVIISRKLAKDFIPPRRSVYLDLFKYLAAQDKSETPFTQSVQSFYALDEALSEFFENGSLTGRHETYRNRMNTVSETLSSLGIESLLPEDSNSAVLKSFFIPPGKTYEGIHKSLKNMGFIIYAGQSHLKEKLFRISLMGDISEQDLNNLKRALEKTFD